MPATPRRHSNKLTDGKSDRRTVRLCGSVCRQVERCQCLPGGWRSCSVPLRCSVYSAILTWRSHVVHATQLNHKAPKTFKLQQCPFSSLRSQRSIHSCMPGIVAVFSKSEKWKYISKYLFRSPIKNLTTFYSVYLITKNFVKIRW